MTVTTEPRQCYIKTWGPEDVTAKRMCTHCRDGYLKFETLYPDRHGEGNIGASIYCDNCDYSNYDCLPEKYIGDTIAIKISK